MQWTGNWIRGTSGLLCAGWMALCLGCGGGAAVPDLYEVKGKVTYQGKPVPGARVVFIPDEKVDPKNKKPPAERPSGETDDQGDYDLGWGEHDGAPVGKYKVVIYAFAPYAPGDDEEQKPPSLIPEKYNNPNTSGLVRDVKDADNVFNFDLE